MEKEKNSQKNTTKSKEPNKKEGTQKEQEKQSEKNTTKNKEHNKKEGTQKEQEKQSEKNTEKESKKKEGVFYNLNRRAAGGVHKIKKGFGAIGEYRIQYKKNSASLKNYVSRKATKSIAEAIFIDELGQYEYLVKKVYDVRLKNGKFLKNIIVHKDEFYIVEFSNRLVEKGGPKTLYHYHRGDPLPTPPAMLVMNGRNEEKMRKYGDQAIQQRRASAIQLALGTTDNEFAQLFPRQTGRRKNPINDGEDEIKGSFINYALMGVVALFVLYVAQYLELL